MKKIIISMLFCGSVMFASANDVYVSKTGNDSNDGLSATAPFATVGKALTAVDDGGTIHVSGFIYTCDDDANPLPQDKYEKGGFPIAKNVTVQGSNKETDGFIGFNEVTYNTGRFFSVNNNGILTLKNLTLKEGVGPDKGGAVVVNGGTLTAENVIFLGCEVEGLNQPSGGAIHVDKTLGVSFKNCLFKQNTAAKGGAFYIQDTQNPNVELRFEACSFVGNKSTQGGASCGGLFFRLPSENLTINILNSTFSGNINGGNGGTIYIYGAQASSIFNIVNCTIVDNIGRSGGGSGAGIQVQEQSSDANKPIINILNSVIEGNAVSDGTIAEDLVYDYIPVAEKCRISNSFIGKVYVKGAGMIPTESHAETLYWDYQTRAFDRTQLLSGIDAFNSQYNVYPLTTGATALNYGSAAFLQTLGVTTDQVGRTRAFAGGKCSVGTMEGVGAPSGILSAELQAGFQVYQENSSLVLNSDKAYKTLELINLSGQTIAKKSGGAETVSIPVGHLQGVYIVRIVTAGEVYTQKIMIK